MDVHLFFLRDQILVRGYGIVDNEGLENLRDDLTSGLFVVRKSQDNEFVVKVNICLEEEIKKLIEKDSKNLATKVYKLTKTREPDVADGLVKRILKLFSQPKWNQASWIHMLKTGVYYTYASDSNVMLDYLVWDGKLEYESYGTYCISSEFMSAILNKDKVYFSWLSKYLDCKDEKAIDIFMAHHGYEKHGSSYTKKQSEPIGFIIQ